MSSHKPKPSLGNGRTAASEMLAALRAAAQKGLRRGAPKGVQQVLFSIRQQIRVLRAEHAVANFPSRGSQPHDLAGELIVSLTSYPPRFPTLAKTLKSLLMQTIKADRTILWLAAGDRENLPAGVLELQEWGIEIRTCEDIRSFKKLIPTLKAFPSAFIVTADDDLYYHHRWLETLVQGVVPGERVIVCRRAHRPVATNDGFAPYSTWEHDIVTDGTIEECIFPTSGGGVLYSPDTLASEVSDAGLFQQLCPDADDVWLFVMALRAGSRFRQVGGGFVQVSWRGSQTASLMSANLLGGNDRQLSAVLEHFTGVDHLPRRIRPSPSSPESASSRA
jgi:hypothetical protein